MSVGNVQISVITPTAVANVAAAAASQQTQAAAPAKTNAPEKAAPVKQPTPVTTTQVSDVTSLSTTAVVLSGLETQLTISKPSDFKGLLENAARSIYDAAAQQESREQSRTLEDIASRIQFAANIVGLSNHSSLSIEAFLG
jgi:hypothetical protein